MINASRLVALTALVTVTTAVPARAQSAAPLENAYVRVAHSLEDVGHKSGPHGHRFAKISIFLTAGEQTLVTTADNSRNVRRVKPGDVIYDGPVEQHVSLNTSTTPLRIIQVEFRKPADGRGPGVAADDPVSVAPKQFSVIADNPQVRVLRLTLAPGAETPRYTQRRKTATVFLSSADAEVIAGGAASPLVRVAHEAAWSDEPVTQQLRNRSAQPLDAIVVELKME